MNTYDKNSSIFSFLFFSLWLNCCGNTYERFVGQQKYTHTKHQKHADSNLCSELISQVLFWLHSEAIDKYGGGDPRVLVSVGDCRFKIWQKEIIERNRNCHCNHFHQHNKQVNCKKLLKLDTMNAKSAMEYLRIRLTW